MSERYILRGPPYKEPFDGRPVGIRFYECLKQLSNTDKIAFLDLATNVTLSYKELYENTVKVAINLKKLGFAGKTLGICSENRTDFFIPVLAALYLGSPVTLITSECTQRELSHACELVKPTIVFCSARTHGAFIMLRAKKSMNYLQQIWILENLRKFCASIEDIDQFKPVEVNVNDHIAAMLFSSGTTGLPKAVMQTHTNLNCVHAHFMDDRHLLSKLTNYLLCLPFYHGYGFHLALATLLRGETVQYTEKFALELFLRLIGKYKVTSLPLVPSLMVILAKHPRVSEYDLSSVKMIVCAGATCSAELEMAVLMRFNNIPRMYQAYGLTESSLSVISRSNQLVPWNGSVGHVDIGVEIKIRNPDNNLALGPDEVGEICIRGATVMKGYYDNPVATRDTITEDGWLLSGDLGYYNKDGCVYVVDRLKELIKYKGLQVPPAELEALLIKHPKVIDVGVVGLPDELAGELPLAFIVKKPGEDLNEYELKDFIKGQVSNAKRLRGGVRFIENIPKNITGKILRKELSTLLNKSKL